VKVLFCCFALRGKKSEVPKPFKCSALEDIWPPAQPRTERIPSPKPWGDRRQIPPRERGSENRPPECGRRWRGPAPIGRPASTQYRPSGEIDSRESTARRHETPAPPLAGKQKPTHQEAKPLKLFRRGSQASAEKRQAH
jgi:hypothetical protein